MRLNLFGFHVEVIFAISGNQPVAYAWHYSRDKALIHLRKITEYYEITGDVVEDGDLLKWLEGELKAVVLEGKRFILPEFPYRNRGVYEAVLRIPRGKTKTYGEIAKESGVPFPVLLTVLLRNPFQILIRAIGSSQRKGRSWDFTLWARA